LVSTFDRLTTLDGSELRVNKLLDRLAFALFPALLFENTPWYRKWMEQDRRESVRLWRTFFPIVSIVYVGHYFLFDRPMGLKPDSLWLTFRMSIAWLSIATTLCYCLPCFSQSKHYKIPAIAMLFLLCYTQARTMVWYEPSQYLYAFVYVVVSVMLLRAPMFKSIAFASSALLCQWPSFLGSGLPIAVAISGTVGTFIFVCVSGSKYASDLRFFLASQMNVDAQRRMLEMNVDFTDRVRSFLPREISTRLTQRLSDTRLSVIQAVDEVLRPTQLPIACLFSDIRGFTQSTKTSQSFLGEGVFPNVKRCNTIIEKFHGIPRKVGDLVFAYYDDPNLYVNLIRCICSGLEITEATQRFNMDQSPETQIRRHVLVSSGIAVVGNLGGYDSSIEITALGSPVNLLSRIDEITKMPSFRAAVGETDIILCPETAKLVTHLSFGAIIEPLDIWALGLRIRDFEEMQRVWLLRSTADNRRAFEGAQTCVEVNRTAPNIAN